MLTNKSLAFYGNGYPHFDNLWEISKLGLLRDQNYIGLNRNAGSWPPVRISPIRRRLWVAKWKSDVLKLDIWFTTFSIARSRAFHTRKNLTRSVCLKRDWEIRLNIKTILSKCVICFWKVWSWLSHKRRASFCILSHQTECTASVIAKKLYSMQHNRFVGSYFKSTRKRANVVPGIIGGSREFYYCKAGTSMQTSGGMHEC